MPFLDWQSRVVAAAFFSLVTVLSAQTTDRPSATPQLLAEGKQLFELHCGGCHGPQGQGGLGPDLRNPSLPNATDANAMYGIIANGIPGTEMPRLRQLHSQQIWGIVSYVETLATNEPESISGDAESGRALYFGKGNCDSCHWLDGSGGRLGPDLSDVGLLRGTSSLLESLVEPSAKLPPGFQLVQVTLNDSTVIEGLRIREDPFAIQLRDYADTVHSILKSNVRAINRTVGTSNMPSYESQLTNQELNDLIAFLATRRGAEANQ